MTNKFEFGMIVGHSDDNLARALLLAIIRALIALEEDNG